MSVRERSESRPEPLLDRLRRRKWRLTAQRRVVAEALAGEHVHLTADQLYERASTHLPELSRATVYNILAELRDLGEVFEMTLEPGAKRYDPNTTHHHQHLVCDRCGATKDVRPIGENGLKLPEAERFGFTVNRVQVVFRGLCAECASGAQAAGSRPSSHR